MCRSETKDRRWRRQRGFTLLEVIVAVFLIGLVLTSLLSALALGIRGTSQAELDVTALQLARSQLENIKDQPYVEPVAYPTIPAPEEEFQITITGSVLEPGVLEEVTVTVTRQGRQTVLTGFKAKDVPPVLANASVPTLPEAWSVLPGTLRRVQEGGALTTDGIDVFGTAGDGTKIFARFNVASPSWTRLADTPAGIGIGGALAFAQSGAADFIFAHRGDGTNRFFRYAIAADTWQTMANTPANAGRGGALAWDGADTIFGTRVRDSRTFWKYTISTNTWSTLANAPGAVGAGGALAFLNGRVYALRGAGTTDFWSYSVASNTWTVLASTPAPVGAGGALTTNLLNIFALGGGGTQNFWRYVIASDTWEIKDDTPAVVGWGGALTFVNPNFYATRGNETTNFWKFGS